MMRLLQILLLLLALTATTNADVIRVTDLGEDFDPSNGTCTLREAMEAASSNEAYDNCQAGNGSDEIVFDVQGLILLTSDLSSIREELHFYGPGADLLTIDGDVAHRIFNFVVNGSSNNSVSGLHINAGNRCVSNLGQFSHLTISDSSITNCSSAGEGGGIFSSGELTVSRSTISGNTAPNGGGISVLGKATIEFSAIFNNSATIFGGGIYSRGDADLDVDSSTLSGNRAVRGGGGIGVFKQEFQGDLDITNSTITENFAGPLSGNSDGGGLMITRGGDVTLLNTVIAGNIDLAIQFGDTVPEIYVEVAPSSFTSAYNLIGDRTGAESYFTIGFPNSNDDFVGDHTLPIDPELGALADNGGPTLTHLPSLDSIWLLDKGACDLETWDQRGRAGQVLVRVHDIPTEFNQEDGCDIGAVEYLASAQPLDFQIKLLLDGAYAGTSTMHTDLNDEIPLAHPYSTAPWNQTYSQSFTSMPSNIVDWVYVLLYRGVPSDLDLKWFGSFGLTDTGRLVKPSNSYFPHVGNPDPHYIVVQHRNHLPVMSKRPYSLSWNLDMSFYDFSSSAEGAYTPSASALRDRGDGSFTVWGGNGIADEGITAFDFLNVWLVENGGAAGYLSGDFNMSGDVSAFDFLNVWLVANGQASQIP